MTLNTGRTSVVKVTKTLNRVSGRERERERARESESERERVRERDNAQTEMT